MNKLERLKIARAALGVSRAAMARMLATPYPTYYKWENEERRVPGIAVKCAELLVAFQKVPKVFKKGVQ